MHKFLKHTRRRLKQEGLGQFFYRIGRFFVFRYLRLKNFLRINLIRLKSRGVLIAKEISGSKMYLDLKDKGLSRDLLLSGIREPFSTEAIKNEIKSGDIVIDIGANIGYYALLEAKLAGESGKIYAIEPVPQNMSLLMKNIALNNLSTIEISQLAIGSENKIGHIYLSSGRNQCSFNLRDARQIVGSTEVKVITLDEFLENKPYPDFIRMDIEGYEFEAIKGMENTFKKNKPLKIFMEIHPTIIKEKTTDLLDILQKYGFKIKKASREPDPSIIGSSGLAKRLFDFFCSRIKNESLHPGYFNTNINDLKNTLIKSENAVHVFFERK